MNILDYDSPKTFLKKIIEKRKNANSLYSMRAFSKQVNISVSAISSFLKGERQLSVQSIERISRHLKLNLEEKNYLITLNQIECFPSEEFRDVAKKSISLLTSKHLLKSEIKFNNLIKNNTTSKVYQYCNKYDNSSRKLILYKKKDGETCCFIDHYTCTKSLKSKSTFFLRNADSTYIACSLDSVFENIYPRLINKKNAKLKVRFINNTFPQVDSLMIFSSTIDSHLNVNLNYSDKVVELTYLKEESRLKDIKTWKRVQ